MGILNLKKILLKATIGSIMFNDVMTKLDKTPPECHVLGLNMCYQFNKLNV